MAVSPAQRIAAERKKADPFSRYSRYRLVGLSCGHNVFYEVHISGRHDYHHCLQHNDWFEIVAKDVSVYRYFLNG